MPEDIAATIGHLGDHSNINSKKDDYRISKGAIHTILAVLGSQILIVVATGIGMYSDMKVLKNTVTRLETSFDRLTDKLVDNAIEEKRERNRERLNGE